MSTILTSTPKKQIFVASGKVFTKIVNDLFSGWTPDNSVEVLEKEKASFYWKGGKIPFELWEAIVCFLRWSQATHRQEALVTLFYNRDTKTWAADVLPQQPMGMTVKSLSEDPQYPIIRAKYGRGWTQLGSVHHHCLTGAFQSSTDHSDEMDRDGLHITLGKMTDDVVDIHLRAVFDGVMYQTAPRSWIEFPRWVEAIPPTYEKAFDASKLFVMCKDRPFPEEWKSRIILRPTHTHYGHGYDNDWEDYGGGDWNWNAEKKTEGGKEAASTGETGSPGNATEPVSEGSAGEVPTEQPDTAAAPASASPVSSEEYGERLEKHGVETLRKIHKVLGDMGIDFTTAYGILIEQDKDKLQEEEWKMRVEMLSQFHKQDIHPFYAVTLMEKIGVSNLQ